MDTLRAQKTYGLFCLVSVLASVYSVTDDSWCKQHTPVLKMCQQGSLQNVTEVFIDTAGIPRSQASNCTCNVMQVNRGDLDPVFNLSVLNTSYMLNIMRFQFKNIVLNRTNIKDSTHSNDDELLFIKSGQNNTGGACLRITSDVNLNMECKPQRISTGNPTGNPSTDSVTQASNVTHHMPEDDNTISGIAIPIGTSLAMLVIVLSVILIVIVRKRRRRHHHHSDKDTTNNEAVEDDSVDHAVDMKSKDEYEYVDNVDGLLNATGAKSTPVVAGSVNEYDYTICKEVSSAYGMTADDPLCQIDSTYDRVQSTRPHPTHTHTDNIYNKFSDTDTYNSINATPNFKLKTLNSKTDEDYSLMEIQ